MSNTSHISVFMATCNGERFLEEQLHSILSQTSPPAELIVCDDQSKDNTLSILDKYKRKGYLQYFINEPAKGVTANFAQAFNYTLKNNWVAFSDQDDLWLPDKLKIFEEEIIKISPAQPYLLYSDAILINEKNEILNHSFWNELGLDGYHHSLQTLILGNYVLGCTALISPGLKKHLSDIPADIALHHDAWMALYAYCFGAYKEIQTALVRYRKHEGNLTSISRFNKNRSISDDVKNHLLLLIRNDYLNDQVALIEIFMQQYASQLNDEQKQMMQAFLKIKNKTYLYKKTLLKKILATHWKNV